MDFVKNYEDNGAPEINITFVARVERISAGQIRVTYYSRRKDDNIVVLHVVWDYQMWLRAVRAFREAFDVITKDPFPFCETDSLDPDCCASQFN